MITTILLLIFTGFMVGIVSAFFGVGGGIITIPILYSLFPEIPPEVMIGSSLCIITINSMRNTFALKKIGKSINKNLCIILILGISTGAIIGTQVTSILPAKTIKIIFGVFALIVAIKTALFKIPTQQDKKLKSNNKIMIYAFFSNITAGIVSGLTGSGGGAVMIPLFLTVLKMPLNLVSTYSNISMTAGAMIGTIRFILIPAQLQLFNNKLLDFGQVGMINIPIVLLILTGAFTSTKIGVRLGESVKPALSKLLFSILLTIISIKIFFSVFA